MYSKSLLNKGSAINAETVAFIERCIASEDDKSKYYFHRVKVHHWDKDVEVLYEAMREYFSVSFIPVNFSTNKSCSVSTFYTSSLNLILNIINSGFVLVPFGQKTSLVYIEVLLNDKTSVELFNYHISLEEIVTEVVSQRFKPNKELDLSNFCEDEKFVKNKIHFYKLALLTNYKLLMLRMGRDCEILNLSRNKLEKLPLEVMNFFIRANVIGLNLSYNEISSLSCLQRVNSKIEKVWTEGNPFCAHFNVVEYIREVMKKFPRVVELDGIKISNYGILMPFHKHFIINDESDSYNIVEEFVNLYFAHYDSKRGRNVKHFYDINTVFTLSSNLNDIEKLSMPNIGMYCRNLNKPTKAEYDKMYYGVNVVDSVMRALPSGTHDLTSFRVDIIHDSGDTIVFVIDGLFTEDSSHRCFSFRRTFVLDCKPFNDHKVCLITNEMFTIILASKDMKATFQGPTRYLGELTLVNPTQHEEQCMVKILRHFTRLKKTEAETRMRQHKWDLRECLAEFKTDAENNMIAEDAFSSDEETAARKNFYEID